MLVLQSGNDPGAGEESPGTGSCPGGKALPGSCEPGVAHRHQGPSHRRNLIDPSVNWQRIPNAASPSSPPYSIGRKPGIRLGGRVDRGREKEPGGGGGRAPRSTVEPEPLEGPLGCPMQTFS